MYNVFGSLRSFLKVDQVIIDNNAFKLHYKATVLALLACSLVVTSRQFIGEPIDCIQSDDVPKNVINTYCWIMSTFTLPGAMMMDVGSEVPQPGISKALPDSERTHHAYYQWVCFVLFLQAAMFYVPRWLWKTWEGNRLKDISLDLSNPILTKEKRDEKVKMLTQYLYDHLNQHNVYALQFFLCEFLNFVNVIGQIYFTNRFLGGEFTTYGLDVLRYTEWDQENRFDPMIRVFPRVTKCTFRKFGSSGDIQKHDALCILSLNIVNEKIYIFLWLWFVMLAIVSGLVVIYRVILVLVPKVRLLALQSNSRMSSPKYLDSVLRHCQVGDWLILHNLSLNVERLTYPDLIYQLATRLDTPYDSAPLLEETSA